MSVPTASHGHGHTLAGRLPSLRAAIALAATAATAATAAAAAAAVTAAVDPSMVLPLAYPAGRTLMRPV